MKLVNLSLIAFSVLMLDAQTATELVFENKTNNIIKLTLMNGVEFGPEIIKERSMTQEELEGCGYGFFEIAPHATLKIPNKWGSISWENKASGEEGHQRMRTDFGHQFTEFVFSKWFGKTIMSCFPGPAVDQLWRHLF